MLEDAQEELAKIQVWFDRAGGFDIYGHVRNAPTYLCTHKCRQRTTRYVGGGEAHWFVCSLKSRVCARARVFVGVFQRPPRTG